MSYFREYATIIGSALLTLLLMFLFGPPFFSGTVSFIDTELSEATQGGIPVRTKMDLALEEQLKVFPRQIDGWAGVDQTRPGLREKLGADVLLMRAYKKADLYWPVFVLVTQGSSRSSFHPPPVCYRSLGYEIEEEGEEEVYVSDTAWVEKLISEGQLSRLTERQLEAIPPPYSGRVSVKKLVVFKQDNGEVIDRRVVLYFYIKDRKSASDKISMVQVSSLAYPPGSYDDAVSATKVLMGEVIPLMFMPREQEKMLITYLVEWGISGYLVILLLFSVPLAIIIYPKIMARRG